jgi:HSP20 family protein
MLASRMLLPNLRGELDRVFSDFFENDLLGRTPPFPALNVWEDAEAVFVEAELPGFTMDDLELLVRGNEFTLRGTRKPLDDEKAVYLRRERGVGEFVRFINLPVEIDADHVEASLRDGVLTVRMPKHERSKARKIQVKTS